ncbi:hypothetical protein H633G_11311 [Metarhizium anisopliae BRIP 53284]|nr:hypothetical protein H633G_11311 [Metarhizium anisopliae BRIP 53284]
MAYLDWDNAENDRIEADIAQEARNGRLDTGRRGMGELWERAARDDEERQAQYEAQEEESCIIELTWRSISKISSAKACCELDAWGGTESGGAIPKLVIGRDPVQF